MASITASGYFHGRYRSVTCSEPGTLSGDPALCEIVRCRIGELEGVYIGPPTGGGRVMDQMGWPGAFGVVAREVLENCEFSGDLFDHQPTEPRDPDVIE